MLSISRRVSISLVITTIVTSLCGYGWIYRQSRLTEKALRERALLGQAEQIANHLLR